MMRLMFDHFLRREEHDYYTATALCVSNAQSQEEAKNEKSQG